MCSDTSQKGNGVHMDTTLKFYAAHPDEPIAGLRLTPEGKLALLVADTALVQDATGRYGTRCPHGHTEMWRNMGMAEIAQQHPVDWCNDCWQEVQWWKDYQAIAARIG